MVTEKYKGSTYGPVKFTNFPTPIVNYPKKNQVTSYTQQHQEQKKTKLSNKKTTKVQKSRSTIIVSQSFSDSNLLPHKLPQSSDIPTSNAARGQDTGRGPSYAQKLRKPSISLSETHQKFNKKADSKTGRKISTNSTRLIQQFPNKFCTENSSCGAGGDDGVKTNERKKKGGGGGQIKSKSEPNEGLIAQVVQCGGESFPSQISISTADHNQQPIDNNNNNNNTMFATDGKKPLSLMEQKKLQWAREKEELNGLWSPWGRPISKTQHTSGSTYVNKLQTSSIQSVLRSEYHLPPIANNNNMSPASRQAQLKSSLWTCDEAINMRVNGRSTLPICINATTGEVLYSSGSGSSDHDDMRDTLHVNNNAVLISGGHNNNNNNGIHNALSIKSLKYDSNNRMNYVDGKRTASSSHFSQQQSAHSVNSGHNGWSSVDEEAFTSGYHSEVNGSLSNSEDCGSRKGSGEMGKHGRGGGQSVFVHNIQMEPKLEIPDRGLTISREKLHENHHSNSGKNSHRSKFLHNAPPPAMRSSITVGLDSGKLEPDAYKELQKLERERWLQELEKQREEQRIRKQQEKDEKRPKWGDKGIGVGHFWEPSSSNDNLPQPSRDDTLATSPPAWLEKGLSRLQNSVSQPSLYDATEFQGPASATLFANQSTMDLRNVTGLDGSERNYLGDEPTITPEVDTNAEREKKRREAMEHQAAIRKQIEERQQRLKEERDRRLQEELKDEENAKLHRLRELEMIELEARRMGMAAMQNQSEESEESPELMETKDVRKLLHKEERVGQKDTVSDGRVSRETVRSNISEGRRLSLDGKNSRTGAGPEVRELPEPKVAPQSPSYLTSSQSMVNIASPGPKARSHKSEPEDVGFLSDSLRARREKSAKETDDRQSSNRSRSLSSHRSFGTQTEAELAAAAQEKKNNPTHRSHNCLANKGNNKSNTNLAEDSEAKKKQEKPRWGATQNKKQYIKQSEKDPMYQQRLKRRQDRIKKFEERLNAANIANGMGLMPGRGMDTGTESEDPTTNNSSSGNGRARGRSPPNRSRNRSTHVGVNAENKTSPRKQVPLKATARIQVSHKPPLHTGETPRTHDQDSNSSSSSRARKIFPDIPGRTIGPLNSAGHQDFDSFRINRGGGTSSVNSSRFSSPSLESMSSRNVETHHYMRQRVAGESVEVDLESRISTRSLEIRYEDQKGTEVHLISPPSKKTIIESSSDEISTYRKTVINQTTTSRISEEEEIEQRNQITTSSRSTSNPPPSKGRVPAEKPPQPPASPIIKANNMTTTATAAKPKQIPVQSATSNLSAAESKTKSRSESRQRRVPPPKTISSTDMDMEVTADERKPAETKKRKGSQRTPAKVPIPNPLVNSSPLVSPVPHNPIPYPTRMGSPPVPAVLKKLQAGIPIEDLPVCDDPLYEVPRTQSAAGSTSNGYKSVESDSSQSHAPPLLSRFSSTAGLEIDIDPTYELSSIRITTQSPPHTEEDTEHNDSFDQAGLIKEESEEDYDDGAPPPSSSAPMMSYEPEDASDDKDEEYEKQFKSSYEEEEDVEDDDDYGGKTTDGYDDPIYPYPIPRFSPRLKSQPGLLSPPTSPVVPRLSGRTTTLEVMADYRKFTLPDYDFDASHLFPHVDVDGMDVTAAVHNIRRPSTQDTDLSKREKLISYVINNKDIQAQISARDSELSEKGIIEFNVRLPVNEEDNYGSSGAGDYDDYKDPLLSDRQRATIRWLYSSDSNSSESKDSILTHLSYLKKGIQQQQHEWNVLPSDTEEETDYHYSGSTNENSSDESKYFSKG